MVMHYIRYLVQRIGYTGQSILENDYGMSLGLTRDRLNVEYVDTFQALETQVPPFELVNRIHQNK